MDEVDHYKCSESRKCASEIYFVTNKCSGDIKVSNMYGDSVFFSMTCVHQTFFFAFSHVPGSVIYKV